ncbi:efflux RND transporter periplasmic adaptor subunit [Paenibacillus thiaminolyticus]|uniref:efflux RND transporter periplasmic adaptor subunit n=1 Tax=Paenibacillus thiaminolyticus TaxID=49283 RepID=UPI003D2AFC8B
MQIRNEKKANKRNRTLAILFGLFMSVLLLLTLFSNTLQTATLPKVTTEKAAKKAFIHTVEGKGTIAPRMKKELSIDSGWKVAAVHVRADENVKKGQVLVTFDSAEANQQLLDLEDQLKKQNLNREALKEQYVLAQRSGDEEEIRRAKRNLDVDQVDWDIAQRQIDSMKKDIQQKRTLTAPFDGKVEDINVEKGEGTSPGQPLLTLVNSTEGFQFTFGTNADAADLLRTGDKVPVEVKGNQPQRLEGTIADIQLGSPDSNGDQGSKPGAGSGNQESAAQASITINISGGELRGGEQASVKVTKQAKEQGLVVRKEMIKKDGQGSYLFVVRANRSPLGNTYVAQKAYVETGEENEEEIIILDGVSPDEDIIVESSDPLQDGNRIRLN